MAPPNPTALESAFIFNPHILWDPIGPWPWYGENPDPSTVQQMMLIRLQHHKEVLALQSKAIDQAISLISKQR
jgi:hypothetical protein